MAFSIPIEPVMVYRAMSAAPVGEQLTSALTVALSRRSIRSDGHDSVEAFQSILTRTARKYHLIVMYHRYRISLKEAMDGCS